MRTLVLGLLSLLAWPGACGQVRQKQRPRPLSSKSQRDPGLQTNSLESQCHGKPLDFVFVIDSSRSVRPEDYEKVKTFILNVLSGLEVGEHSTRVGLLQYGSVVQNEFSLNAYRRRADVERAIRSMAHLASGTMTGLALRYTTEEAFSEEQGARPKSMQVPRMAMVVTDGRPQDKVEEAAAEARQAGIEIFAVGVGRVDMATLRAIGSEPHLEHVFLVANFSQIETLTTVFHDKLCADLCSGVDHQCDHICVSAPTSYMCKCRKGYILNPDGKTCREEDMCAMVDHGCQHICANLPEGYECRCREGYELDEDGKTCRKIDFCDLGNHGCEHDCISTADSYACRCKKGYILNLDGKTCSKIDQCALGDHGCEHECVNTEDSFVCRCHEGYALKPDGKTCKKIDQCAVGDHGCEHECVNTEDSFVCRCQKGYTLRPDGKTCKKIDQCALGDHGCEHECVNTEDSFVCRCHKGYTLRPDGKTCKGLDICQTVDHGCEHQCVGTAGSDSYVCICFEGYTLAKDGKSCKKSDCGGGVMDLVFVIDGSKSLGTANFDRVKKWVSGIVETLAVSKRGTQVGLIQYSTKVRTEFTLAQHHSAQAIQQAVASMQYMGRGSMTGSALRHMFERSFSAAQGGRHGVPRACVVFTDGRSQDDVSGWATKAKQAGVTMYAVGVGKAIEDELREIASEPDDKHLYYAEDFNHMGDITDKLQAEICHGKPAPTDQCECKSLVAFQNQASEQIRKLNQKLEAMTKKIESLENHRKTK
ncbi:matrilin-2 isoform X2 [Clupea harengus]|uniref:Matrilin-2 isoform X2 n=1 Tax=Clupea harengus TaxID=7950 RepID=A0A6P8G9Z6_CLUHA|nr:matrilin-2 isoform X2 [Clupea harengus]